MSKNLIKGKIFVPGGIVSPGELRRLASTCVHFGIPHLHLGKRQEILVQFDESRKKDLGVRFSNLQYKFQAGTFSQANIVSSSCMRSIDSGRKWLSEGVYREVISSFTFEPSIKINICDPLQGLFPLFGGKLNFIASEFQNYWHLYILNSTKKSLYEWPVLVDSKEIAHISFEIEKILKENPVIDLKDLEKRVYNVKEWTFRIITEKPDFKPNRFFYYEGIHPMGEKKYWLGIFERLNQYPVQFMEAVAALCGQTDIGAIHITPYKSLLIKNIAEKDLILWENLLGKFKINTGHSELEVNFILPDLDKEAYNLRKAIFDHFDNTEVRSEGLVFSLHSDPSFISGASVMVEKVVKGKIGPFALHHSYKIRYKKDFNPNSFETITFSEFVKKRDVPGVLRYICEKYYEQRQAIQEKKSAPKKIVEERKEFYACSTCLTEYDEQYGDSYNGILPGIPFSMLPDNYKCPVCEAAKSNFFKIAGEQIEA